MTMVYVYVYTYLCVYGGKWKNWANFSFSSFLLKRKLRIMISLDEWRKRERAIGGLLFDNQVLSEKCQWLVID